MTATIQANAIAAAWSLLVGGSCFMWVHRHARIASRLQTLADVAPATSASSKAQGSTQRPPDNRSGPPATEHGLSSRFRDLPLLSAFFAVSGAVRERSVARRAALRLQYELPLAVDLLAVSIGAGATPLTAMEIVERWAPHLVAREFADVLRDVDFGIPLAESLRAGMQRTPLMRPLCETLVPAIRLGSPLIPALARVAAEVRATHSRQMAAIARTVPVRLIFPLVLLVLPAFGLLTVVPSLVAGWQGV